LADFSERLQYQFGDKFGTDKIHVLSNTKVVNKSDLEVDHCYLQIISLDVYLTPEELKSRETIFEQNFNIKRFIFETPFTKSGKAHGDMAEQYKRKTILTVESSFPYLKKRLKIVHKSEAELTPIETNIELIERKIVSLKAELSTATPNIKALQLALQGSLLLQVNVGPLEICRVFLGDNMTKYNKEYVERAIVAMSEFVKTLGRALEVNQALIKPDQLAFHKELEKGYSYFQQELTKHMTLDLGQAEEEPQVEESLEDEDD